MKRSAAGKSATSVPGVGTPVGIRDLRDHLSAYLERVKAGEVITVTEHGRPIARLAIVKLYLVDEADATDAHAAIAASQSLAASRVSYVEVRAALAAARRAA